MRWSQVIYKSRFNFQVQKQKDHGRGTTPQENGGITESFSLFFPPKKKFRRSSLHMRRGGERYTGWIIATFLIYTINPLFLEDPHVHGSVYHVPQVCLLTWLNQNKNALFRFVRYIVCVLDISRIQYFLMFTFIKIWQLMVNEGLIPSPEDDKKRRSVIHMLQRVNVFNLSRIPMIVGLKVDVSES